MNIQDAQRQIRLAFLGGFAGQLVSGILWLISAALSTWISQKYGMVFLFLSGMFIFPLTQLTLRMLGRSAKLSAENSLNQLATQIALTVPIGFLLTGAATLYRFDWFYPAAMIVVGAHYLPFLLPIRHVAVRHSGCTDGRWRGSVWAVPASGVQCGWLDNGHLVANGSSDRFAHCPS